MLILTALLGLAAAFFLRRRRTMSPQAPTPVEATPASARPLAALGFGRAVIGVRPARPILTLVENPHASRSPYAAPALAPATQVAGGTLPPQLAAACQVPTGFGRGGHAGQPSTPGLPSTYHGVAA